MRTVTIAATIALSAAVTACTAPQQGSRSAAPEIRLVSSASYVYRDRVAEQVAVEFLAREAQSLRFRLKSAIMRDAWGEDDVLARESWAVPVGITNRGGARYLAVVTTRCVLDYRYPLAKKMPNWSNLALFSQAGAAPNRQDVGAEVFRIAYPADLPGVVSTYDPKRDALFFTSREYLNGKAGERYFGVLKNGGAPTASAELPLGSWSGTSGADLAVVHFPLADPGVSALRPERTLGMADPVSALRTVLEPRVSLWGDTFRFSLISEECIRYAQRDYQNVEREAQTWRALALAAGALLAANVVLWCG